MMNGSKEPDADFPVSSNQTDGPAFVAIKMESVGGDPDENCYVEHRLWKTNTGNATYQWSVFKDLRLSNGLDSVEDKNERATPDVGNTDYYVKTELLEDDLEQNNFDDKSSNGSDPRHEIVSSQVKSEELKEESLVSENMDDSTSGEAFEANMVTDYIDVDVVGKYLVQHFLEGKESGQDLLQRKGQNPEKRSRNGSPIPKNLTCDRCLATFRYQSTYKSHCQSRCKKIKRVVRRQAAGAPRHDEPNECKVCNKMLSSRTSLFVHMRLHTGERPFTCSFCGKSFHQNAHRKDHIANIHTPGRSCQRAGMAARHHCRQCKISFEERIGLNKHLAMQSCQSPYFECDVCSARFTSRMNLKQDRTVLNEKQFKCNQCHLGFVRKITWLANMKPRSSVSAEALPCGICPKMFSNRDTLKNHQKRHRDNPNSNCTVCGKHFATNFELRQHWSTHTGERPFGCDICQRKFTRKAIMELHRTLHTGRKDFVCTDCGESFNRKAKLDVHRVQHTGEAFQCEICKREFKCKSYLVPHLRQHAPNWPHKCDSCPETFRGQRSLLSHLSSAHPSQPITAVMIKTEPECCDQLVV